MDLALEVRMDNFISGFQKLMAVDHIAWADGPGWLLGLMVAWVVMIAVAANISRT